MANIKNFGLIGVGVDLQLGKGGLRLISNKTAGELKLLLADGSTPAKLNLGGLSVAAESAVDFGGNVLANVGTGVESTDAVNLGQVGTLVTDAVDTAIGELDFSAKADVTYVDTELEGKADTTYVDEQLFTKADVEAVNTALEDKADKTYVDAAVHGLSWKAPVDFVLADHLVDSEEYVVANLAQGVRVANSASGVIYVADGAGGFDDGMQLLDGHAFFDRTQDKGFVFNGEEIVQFSSLAQVSTGNGLVQTDGELNLVLDGDTLTVGEDGVKVSDTLLDTLATKEYADTKGSGANAVHAMFDASGEETSVSLGAITGFVHRVKVYITTAAVGHDQVTIGTDELVEDLVSKDDIDSSAAGMYVVEVGKDYEAQELKVFMADGAIGRVIVEYFK